MRVLRVAVRLCGVLIWLFLGLLPVVVFPVIGSRARDAMVRHWSCLLLRCCGVAVTVRGVAVLNGPVLTVANHVSWIDVFVLNSVRATCFIAKSEIRHWPLIGWLVVGAGAMFLERGRGHALKAVSQAMRRRFDQGEAVGLFPEGTTSPGWALLPFHASLFAPACDQSVTVQPVALRFTQHGKRSDCAAFVGDEALAVNVWRVLGATGLAVEAVYLPPLSVGGIASRVSARRRMARAAQGAIAQVLQD